MGWRSKLEYALEELQWKIKEVQGLVFGAGLTIAIAATCPAIIYAGWRSAVFVFAKAKSLIFTGTTEVAFFPKRSFEEIGPLQYGSLREWLHFLVDWSNYVIGWVNSGIDWFNNLAGFWQGYALNGLWVCPVVIGCAICASLSEDV